LSSLPPGFAEAGRGRGFRRTPKCRGERSACRGNRLSPLPCLQLGTPEAPPQAASVEVIDLRSLAPFDWNAIRTSVEKTNRVIVAHEDCLSFGYAAEIAARIADELFDRLDAPVRRVAALDTRVAYQPQVENAILPQVEDLVAEMERMLAY
jgi:pyruvate/2-oxoglutarate/acetoin dehydrogenase E1 component